LNLIEYITNNKPLCDLDPISTYDISSDAQFQAESLLFSINFHLRDFSEVVVKVVDPIALLDHDVFGSHSINNFPLINELSYVSDF